MHKVAGDTLEFPCHLYLPFTKQENLARFANDANYTPTEPTWIIIRVRAMSSQPDTPKALSYPI